MLRFVSLKSLLISIAALVLAFGMSACSREVASYETKAVAPVAESPATPDTASEPVADDAETPDEVAVPPPTPAPVQSAEIPAPSDDDKSSAPLDASCAVDADCAVKDVGNCCGRMPACVNRAAEPDPAGVQRECARTGMASICGFQELSGCRCEASRCVGIASASGGGVEVR